MRGFSPPALEIPVSNDQLVTVREAMRTLNQIVDRLQGLHERKAVLTRHGKMVAVVLSADDYRELLAQTNVRMLPLAKGAV